MRWVVWAGLAATVFLPCLAAAQGRLPSTVEPGRERVAPPAVPQGEFDLSITQPRRVPRDRDVDALRFTVREVVVEGATVLRADELAALTGPLIGREAALSDVLAVAEAIEASYRTAGYLMTRAFVPPQRSRNGVFRILVVEGYVGSVAVEGVDAAEAGRVKAFLAPVLAERPLRNDTMERALLLLNDQPGLKVSGLLKPSKDETGAADMVVSAKLKPAEVTASLDNRSSRYEGPWSAGSDLAVMSPTGHGERLSAGLSTSPELVKKRALRLGYLQPLGSDGLTSAVSLDYSMGRPGYTLEDAGARTFSMTLGSRLAYPLIRGRAESVILDGGLSLRTASSHVDGASVAFDRWRVADLKLAWTQSGWLSGIDTAALGVARGLPMLGGSQRGDASLSRPGINTAFTKLTLDLSRLQSLAPSWSLYVGTSGQYSFDTLFAGEEFALGNSTFGHGFDPSSLVGDHGIGGTAQLRWDVSSTAPQLQSVMLYTFYDAGVTWVRTTDTQQGLASFGGGVRIGLTESHDINIEAAHRLYGTQSTVGGHFARLMLSLTGRF